MEQGYFESFMNEAIKDLIKTGEAFVFNDEQVEYIKQKISNIEIKEDDGIYYIKNKNINVDKKSKK